MNDAQEKDATEEHWAILELMGHTRFGGRVAEVVRYGVPMCRLDVPDVKDPTKIVATQFIGGSAIYRETPCTQEAAVAVARINQPAPVQRWELPPSAPPEPEYELDENGEPEDRDGV